MKTARIIATPATLSSALALQPGGLSVTYSEFFEQLKERVEN